ncbi:hypothetical protein JCM1841_005006 [Sporobolomyces salmonicolor]
MLLPRQQQPTSTPTAPDLFGSTSGPSSSTSSSVPSSSSPSSSSGGSSNNGSSYLWKYAIVAILAILVVSAIGRLVFVQRLRRRRQLALFPATPTLGQRRRRNSDRRRFSTSTVDLEERGSPAERVDSPAPPAYEENLSTGALPLAPAALASHSSPSRFSRLSSWLRRSRSPPSNPGPTRTPAAPRRSRPLPPDLDLDTDWFGLSMRQSADVPQSPHALARLRAEQAAERETSAARQTEAIRRALLDAGLLRGLPPRSLSLSMLGSGAREGGAREREVEREERDDTRRRRRERRRRAREERDEGLGLPVYSKTKGEGEKVLQVAEGVKEDELSDEEDASASEGEDQDGPPPGAAATATATAAASTSASPQTNPLDPTAAASLPATDRPPPAPPSPHPLAPSSSS